MALRCLLFSSNEEMCQPIWQVLTDLGIEGEYCRNAVDAVERVTTQLFQIVITDWDDQPEAAFLLKTTRDQKAAQRPLTLAIVGDDARLPEALRAGANSVLLKPIRAEQVRDTMSTACELLRAKQPPAAPQSTAATAPPSDMLAAAMAAAASASPVPSPASAIPAPAPASVTKVREQGFRAGEFLQTPTSAPGGQFDTESEVQKSLDQAAAAEVEALTELEPMASAVVVDPAAALPEPQSALTGWASLQERLTRSAPPAPPDAPPKNELLSYGETPSLGTPPAMVAEVKDPEATASHAETAHEAALFAYIDGQSAEEPEPGDASQSKRNKFIFLGMLATVCLVLAAVPWSRQRLQIVYRNTTRAGRTWLNPQPVPVVQAPAQHESFGQEGDEYKLPVAGNIPDATTDPSQIRVLPVIDPTAKPVKGAPTTAEGNSNDQGQSASSDGGPVQVAENPVKEQTSTSVENAGSDAGAASPSGIPVPAQTTQETTQEAAPRHEPPAATPPVQAPAPARTLPTGSSSPIPSSLKSQIASMTPEASGAKPVEAAMASIEPVNLPESATWNLLVQKVDPAYPDSAKASGQRGSVVLQVLIGHDGAVQDAKFLQGSLVFARSAIDAVRQWRFKPYFLNGRAVSVQSVITLNFKPPA